MCVCVSEHVTNLLKSSSCLKSSFSSKIFCRAGGYATKKKARKEGQKKFNGMKYKYVNMRMKYEKMREYARVRRSDDERPMKSKPQ
jgi:hypothetical protein